MRTIECTSNSGVSTFFLEGPVEIEDSEVVAMDNWQKKRPRAWRYRVHLRNPPQSREDDSYEAAFVEVDENTVLSMTLTHNFRDHYRGKGITPQVFAHAAKDLQRRIISSTSTGTKLFDNESRKDDATKVWLKLTVTGWAIYHQESDRFEYVPPN